MSIVQNIISWHLICGDFYCGVPGFFHTKSKKTIYGGQKWEVLLIFPNKVFIIFSGCHKKCPSFLTPVTHKGPFSDSSHIQCMPTLDISGIGPILHRRGFHRTDLYSTNIRHQLHARRLSPIHLLQTVRKIVFTAGLLGLLFFHREGVVFAVFLLSLTVFLVKNLTTVQFLICW
jgi:hypothetical protein